jgi:hypothetical protein
MHFLKFLNAAFLCQSMIKPKFERLKIMEIMPLKRVVVELTHQATSNEPASIQKAVRTWHNGLASGTIPRFLVKKFGRELYLDLSAWREWMFDKQQISANKRSVGRPRSP